MRKSCTTTPMRYSSLLAQKKKQDEECPAKGIGCCVSTMEVFQKRESRSRQVDYETPAVSSVCAIEGRHKFSVPNVSKQIMHIEFPIRTCSLLRDLPFLHRTLP